MHLLLNNEEKALVGQLYDNGTSVQDIAFRLSVSASTVNRTLGRLGKKQIADVLSADEQAIIKMVRAKGLTASDIRSKFAI